MVNTIKEVFDSKYFHGRLTDEEAYNLCKEELTNNDKQEVYIWYLFEYGGSLQGKVCGYRRDSEVPFAKYLNVQQLDVYPDGYELQYYLATRPRFLWRQFSINLDEEEIFVERKNPHTLSELGRVATLDSCNGYCCMRSLIEKIDELRIPNSEELKKLALGFQLILDKKIPNNFCMIHND